MKDRYLYESFSSNMADFNGGFTGYLNSKYEDNWKVKDCTFHQDGDEKSASCLFKRR